MLVSSTQTPSDDTAHVNDTHLSLRVLAKTTKFSLQTSTHSCVVCLLFHLHFRGESSCSGFSRCPYISSYIPQSPEVRHSYHLNLPSSMFVCRSQPHRTIVSCSVLRGRRVLSGELSTLYSAARSHSVPAGFRHLQKEERFP